MAHPGEEFALGLAGPFRVVAGALGPVEGHVGVLRRPVPLGHVVHDPDHAGRDAGLVADHPAAGLAPALHAVDALEPDRPYLVLVAAQPVRHVRGGDLTVVGVYVVQRVLAEHLGDRDAGEVAPRGVEVDDAPGRVQLDDHGAHVVEHRTVQALRLGEPGHPGAGLDGGADHGTGGVQPVGVGR